MLKLQVSGITCGGCAAAIERAVDTALPGTRVEVDVMKGTVQVAALPAARAQAAAAIEDAGFIVTGDAV